MRGRLRKSVIAATALIIVAGTTVAVPNSAVTERLIERNPATGVDFGRDSEREGVLNAADYARLSLLVR